jgi:hypothetical protein
MSRDSNDGDFFGFVGAVIAACLSWHTWHSVGWAIIHFLFGWFYVIYWLICIWDKKW